MSDLKIPLKFSDLSQADKDLVDKMVKGGSGEVTRRDALKLAMVTGVSLTAAEQLLTDGKKVLAMTPKKGGSARMSSNLHGPDDQLDPPLFTSTIDYSRGRAIYNNMVQLGDDMAPNPELAESFEPNSDATEWTFKIRKGVSFHDGSPLRPEDVVYSMNRHIGESSTSVMKSILASVKGWRKTGPDEVKADMNTPNADICTSPAISALTRATGSVIAVISTASRCGPSRQ